MGGVHFRGLTLIDTILAAAASGPIRFENLGLDPVAIDFGVISIKWYSLAYLSGILIGYWYLLRLIREPGSPMARRHADDMIFYATLGIIIGGRLAYVLFYQPEILKNPIDILKLWNGGMSFHGGVIGVTCAIIWMSYREKLNWLRVHDYVACCVPFGLLFGRLANFVNGELWGKETDVSWAIIFPTGVPYRAIPASFMRPVWRDCYCSSSCGSPSGRPRRVMNPASWSVFSCSVTVSPVSASNMCGKPMRS